MQKEGVPISPRRPSPLAGEGARRADEGLPEPCSIHSTPRTKTFARRLRRASTEAEKTLWGILRDRRFVDHKFRRQVPIGPYIVDFVCFEARLIVELDGSQHAENARDRLRDDWLARDGYRVLRVWKNDLTDNRDGVLTAIWHALEEPRT
ncbi:MAG: endonuclease domain-containing protein [Devosia sp.]|nr:endonuclease domain-containing protein [Devosia sp.]